MLEGDQVPNRLPTEPGIAVVVGAFAWFVAICFISGYWWVALIAGPVIAAVFVALATPDKEQHLRRWRWFSRATMFCVLALDSLLIYWSLSNSWWEILLILIPCGALVIALAIWAELEWRREPFGGPIRPQLRLVASESGQGGND